MSIKRTIKKKSQILWLQEFEFAKVRQRLEDYIQEKNGQLGSFLKESTDLPGGRNFGEVIYRHLGVCGGSFILADKAKNQLVYLQNKQMQPDLVKEYDEGAFIEIPYRYQDFDPLYQGKSPQQKALRDKAKAYYTLFDAMYIGARDRQPLNGGADDSNPDFYHNLPQFLPKKEKAKLLPFEQYLTAQKFDVIYCAAGEVLFFLIAWRMLFYYVNVRGLNGKVFASDSYLHYSPQFDFWKEIENAAAEELPEKKWLNDLERKQFRSFDLKEKWEGILEETDRSLLKNKEGYSSYDEYFRLGLADKAGCATRDLLELVRYAIYMAEKTLGWESGYDIIRNEGAPAERRQKIGSDAHALLNLYILERRLDIYFQEHTSNPNLSYIPEINKLRDEFHLAECLNRVIRGYFFKKLSPGREEENIIALLRQLHQQSRFPILLYFYELTVGSIHCPKEHLVLGIWHSQDHKVTIRSASGKEKEHAAVVFIALTLKPIWHAFPGNEFIKNGKSSHCHREMSRTAYLRVMRIHDFFRFLARPIIDRVFYGALIKREIKIDYFREYLTAMSHELSKITDNIFEKSNRSVQELLGEQTGQFVQALRQFIPSEIPLEETTVKDWRVIVSPKTFSTWALMLHVWSGRRGSHVFETEGIEQLPLLLKKCNELACKMDTGQSFLSAQMSRKINDFLRYEEAFTVRYQANLAALKGDSDSGKEAEKWGLKRADHRLDQDELTWMQNAFLRLLLACLTNIYEHRSENTPICLRIKPTRKNKERKTFLRFVFVNLAKAEKIAAHEDGKKKSLGTEPVLSNCISLLGGTLENFGPFKADDPLAQERKQEWAATIEPAETEDLWETCFRIPAEDIFEKV